MLVVCNIVGSLSVLDSEDMIAFSFEDILREKWSQSYSTGSGNCRMWVKRYYAWRCRARIC